MTNLKNLQGLEGLQFSEELQYAVECGVKFEVKGLENGDIQVSWNNGQCVEILSFYTDLEEIETAQSEMDNAEVAETEVTTVAEIAEQYNLTEKEQAVLAAIIQDQFEDGLPPFTTTVARLAGLTERQTAGVISSLYKKGFLESYLDDESQNCQDMYHLTSEWFEKFNGF